MTKPKLHQLRIFALSYTYTLFFTHYVQRDWTMTVTTIKQNVLFTLLFTALHVPQPLLSFFKYWEDTSQRLQIFPCNVSERKKLWRLWTLIFNIFFICMKFLSYVSILSSFVTSNTIFGCCVMTKSSGLHIMR